MSKKSESIKQIAIALSKVQANALLAIADAENPFYNSKYADLTSVWNACREPLTENGLSVVQSTSFSNDGDLIVETILIHESGEWISGELKIKPDKPGPQALGSAITYGRRYALASMVGVCINDDDAELATERRGQAPITEKQKSTIFGLLSSLESDESRLNHHIEARFKEIKTIDELNISQAGAIINMLNGKVKEKSNGAT